MASPGCRVVIVPLGGNIVATLRAALGLGSFLKGKGIGAEYAPKKYELLSEAA